MNSQEPDAQMGQEGKVGSAIDIEARLIAQDHRLWPVLKVFWSRKKWPPGDPRRQAAKHALFWRFASRGSMVTSAGLIAIATLYLQHKQTSLLGVQNQLIENQNQYFQNQIDRMGEQNALQQTQLVVMRTQAELERRTRLLSFLYDTKDDGTPVFGPKIRSEALAEFISLENATLPSGERISLAGARLEDIHLVRKTLRNVDFERAQLSGAVFRECTFETCHFELALPVRFHLCTFYKAEISELNREDSTGFLLLCVRELLGPSTSGTKQSCPRVAPKEVSIHSADAQRVIEFVRFYPRTLLRMNDILSGVRYYMANEDGDHFKPTFFDLSKLETFKRVASKLEGKDAEFADVRRSRTTSQ